MITLLKTMGMAMLLCMPMRPEHRSSETPDNTGVTFTILYDNTSYAGSCTADWGFSCLIEGKEKTILFDTGTKPEIFRNNVVNLGVDLDQVDCIVISHNHGDHTGGMTVVLEKAESLPAVYLPSSAESRFLDQYPEYEGHSVAVSEPVELCGGVMLTGEMGDRIKEQSLVVDTEKGLVVITGCSHQGVDNIIKRTTQISDRNIYLVFGGFHLLDHDDDGIDEIISVFQSEGVQKCDATHCSGDEAIMKFKESYGEDFIPMGAGKQLTL